MNALLALKLSLVPTLILGVTLAGRRWGPVVAGGLAAFPVVAGPILFFVSIEQGPIFAAHAAAAAIVGVAGNIAFGIAYSWISRKRPWLISLLGGWFAYFAVIAIFMAVNPSNRQAVVVTVAVLLLAAKAYPLTSSGEMGQVKPVPDLTYRMAAGLALVLAVTVFSAQLGSRLSGLLSVFPVMGSVLAVFSHRNVSQHFAVRLLFGMVRGFYAFVAFCFVLATALPKCSIGSAFAMALAAAVALQGIQMLVQARFDRLAAAR